MCYENISITRNSVLKTNSKASLQRCFLGSFWKCCTAQSLGLYCNTQSWLLNYFQPVRAPQLYSIKTELNSPFFAFFTTASEMRCRLKMRCNGPSCTPCQSVRRTFMTGPKCPWAKVSPWEKNSLFSPGA